MRRRITNSMVAILLMAAPLLAQGPRGPMSGGIMSPPANVRPPGLQFVGIEPVSYTHLTLPTILRV